MVFDFSNFINTTIKIKMPKSRLHAKPQKNYICRLYMKNTRFALPSLLRVSVLFSYAFFLMMVSCQTPEKVLKSTDIEYKKKMATNWYNKKEYFKCIPVFEELIGLMKGRESVEEFYYMYCMANYKQGDYMISAFHFKNFFDQYPNSPRAEECLYMQAKSYQMLSPKPSLDQTYTYKALDAYQFFFNMFPVNDVSKESNEAISQLRKKLEKKALAAADLYYRTSNYKAAATAYENLLKDYPDIDEDEKISFMIVKGNYKFAENSVPDKKVERYKHVIDSYNIFKDRFAASKLLEEAKNYYEESHYYAVKSAFEWAEIAPLDEREKHYRTAFAEAKAHREYLLTETQKKEFDNWVEKGHFLMIKNAYLLSEERKEKQRLQQLEQTVRIYYNFVDLFPNSRYVGDAEKIFNNTNTQIKKLKSNG
jgi:outer membrane protein assembly factor BamD